MSHEEGSSSHAVSKQEINAEELKPILSKSVEILVDFVKNRGDTQKFSPIYKVPSRLREVNPNSFTPRVVSIGPLHNGRANLKLMEEKKAIYLYELLEDVEGSPEEILTKCEKKVNDSIEEIRRCYFGMNYEHEKKVNDSIEEIKRCNSGINYKHEKTVNEYTDDELTQMMIKDACFILQFINKLKKIGDELSYNRLRSRSVAVDLMLLENQIPFFVLQDIYDLTLKTLEAKPPLITMLHDLLERVNPFSEKLKLENLFGKNPRYHILSLLHEFYQPEKGFDIPSIPKIPTAHSTVQLHEFGVRFRPKGDKIWPLAMKFEKSSHKPTLRMPKVLIDNFFEVVMRNLIAYEQYSTPVRNYVTSYAMAMDMLAATPADIAKLAESNVIISQLGSNEKVSNMISSICKDVTFPDFYYIESWTNAKKHCESYWYKNIGVFKRKYCSTPWKALALFAGIIVFFVSIAAFVLRVITFKSKHFS